jgi:hypothetical protein
MSKNSALQNYESVKIWTADLEKRRKQKPSYKKTEKKAAKKLLKYHPALEYEG